MESGVDQFSYILDVDLKLGVYRISNLNILSFWVVGIKLLAILEDDSYLVLMQSDKRWVRIIHFYFPAIGPMITGYWDGFETVGTILLIEAKLNFLLSVTNLRTYCLYN